MIKISTLKKYAKAFGEQLVHKTRSSPRLMRISFQIAKFSHSPISAAVFFILFAADAILTFLPADTLLAATLLIDPNKKRTWVLSSLAGAFSAYLAIYVLSLTTFQENIIHWISILGFHESYLAIVNHASSYGYSSLIVGVLTFAPPSISLIAAIVVGLNPFLCFCIVAIAKWIRLELMIFLFRLARKSLHRVRS